MIEATCSIAETTDPVYLAQQQGVSSQLFATVQQLPNIINQAIAKGPQLGLIDGGQELPCYIINIEEFYTPINYQPPASRQVIIAHNEQTAEWLLLAVNWFAGLKEIVLPSYLFIDELQMLSEAVHKLSDRANLHIYNSIDIYPLTRTAHLALKMESSAP